METWEVVLLAVSALVAVRLLVVLMRRRRNDIVQSVQKQLDQFREHQRELRRRQRQQEQHEDVA